MGAGSAADHRKVQPNYKPSAKRVSDVTVREFDKPWAKSNTGKGKNAVTKSSAVRKGR
jgi:hypothetical protein